MCENTENKDEAVNGEGTPETANDTAETPNTGAEATDTGTDADGQPNPPASDATDESAGGAGDETADDVA